MTDGGLGPLQELVGSVLDELELPTFLAGDEIVWFERGERGEAYFFDPFGKPFPGEVNEQARAFEEARYNGENQLVTSLWWNQIPVEVSTVYLGANHNFWGGAPIVWETMIFAGLDRAGVWQFRYCTRTAAFAAHPMIIESLLAHGFVYADPELEHAHDQG